MPAGPGEPDDLGDNEAQYHLLLQLAECTEKGTVWA
jgi:hypothetical protein